MIARNIAPEKGGGKSFEVADIGKHGTFTKISGVQQKIPK